MYNIKNSKELASYINYTNLNNIISEEEMKEFLEKAKETTFHSVVVSPTYVQLAKESRYRYQGWKRGRIPIRF